eukprot:g6015.t1
MMDSPKYMKRKITPGLLEMDYRKKTLIINYDVEATVQDEYGDLVQQEKRSQKKKIRLITLSEHTDVSLLAEDIVAKNKLIHHAKLPRVEQLLLQLQEYIIDGGVFDVGIEGGMEGDNAVGDGNSGDRDHRSKSGKKSRSKTRRDKRGKRQQSKSRKKDRKDKNGGSRFEEQSDTKASMEEVDQYLEEVYSEDIKDKAWSTSRILELAREPKNLGDLIQNEPLMGALSRVFKEDYKKSMDLCLNLGTTFFNFSKYSQMHGILMSKGIGAMSMKVIELEIKRYDLRMEEMKKMTLSVEKERKRRDSKISSDSDDIIQIDEGDFGTGGGNEKRRGKNKSNSLLPDPSTFDLRKEKKKTNIFIKKQEKLLYVTVSMLLNLAEDLSAERKMVKKGIVRLLGLLLDRKNVDLLTLVTVFLKKLSVFKENKDKMKEEHVIPKLLKFVGGKNTQLSLATLRLLFNISFDPEARQIMVEQSLIPRLVGLLKQPQFRAIVLRLMYHLSIDDRHKSFFTYTEAIPLVMQLVINFPQSKLPKELAALAINLSLNGRNAELMTKGRCLKLLIERLHKTKDTMLAKCIRNIAQWTHDEQELLDIDFNQISYRSEKRKGKNREGKRNGNSSSSSRRRDDSDSDRSLSRSRSNSSLSDENDESRRDFQQELKRYAQRGLWAMHVEGFAKLAKRTDDPDLLLIVLSILSLLTPLDMPEGEGWKEVVQDFGLMDLLSRLLVPGMSTEDVMAESLALTATFLTDKRCAQEMRNTRLPRTVVDMLRTKRDDVGLLLAILNALHRMLRHRCLAEELLYSIQCIPDICDLLINPSVRVRESAERILEDVVAVDARESKRRKKSKRDSDDDDDDDDDEDEEEPELTKMIRTRRFELHNIEWMEMLTEIEVDEGFVEEGKLYYDDGSERLSRDDLGGGLSDSLGMSESRRSVDGLLDDSSEFFRENYK